MRTPPARPGMPVADVDTPALLVDLDAFEHNLKLMMDAVRATGVRVRPHAKTHKCAEIARRQVALGAVGVCCQKVGEAEAMVEGGIADVLVTNEIVGAGKLARLAALAGRARIGVCVDHPLQVDALAAAIARAGTTIDGYVELDIGQGRCGVAGPGEIVALARRVAAQPGLRFAGLQSYHGRAQHLREPAERARAIQNAQHLTGEAKSALEAAGIGCPAITGAGTGTFALEAGSGLWTEIQPGSYVFMDIDYGRNRPASGAPVFRTSLHVLGTVMSVSGGRLVLDAGLKAYSVDSGLPYAADAPGWQFAKATDEHGVLTPASSAPPLPVDLGAKLRLVPGHCDPTVNLHDWIVAVRGDTVEAVWAVEGRGALS